MTRIDVSPCGTCGRIHSADVPCLGNGRPVTRIPHALGWQCPSCGSCYAPKIDKCEHCGPLKPPFVNTFPDCRKCSVCRMEVRPGYIHAECYREGEKWKPLSQRPENRAFFPDVALLDDDAEDTCE